MAVATWKDYRLGGERARATILTEEVFGGHVEQRWFSARIDRKTFKQLIRRSDAPALKFFGLWLALLAASGVGGVLLWGTWWAVPFFAVYGVLYSAADHRHHELSHGTPLKTRWLNDVLYHLCAFMTLREGFYYRWSHTRHHTHTLIVGQDPEIAAKRPPFLLGIASDVFFVQDGITQLGRLLKNASGDLTEDGKHFVPDAERGKVVWASRVYLLVIAAVVGSCFAFGTILPLMLVVGPRFYGGALSQVFNLTQHAGLDEDVYDHRLNTRTILMNPVFSWLYANMNYHIEHHMFPMVPFYRLPELHEMIKDQCPKPYDGLREAYAEIIPALIRQRREPTFFVRRELPKGAEPEVLAGDAARLVAAAQDRPACPPATPARAPRSGPSAMDETPLFPLAACAEMLFRGLPMAERVRRIAGMGFMVEIWDWTKHDIAALAATGAVFSSMTGYVHGALADDEGADELVRTARQSIPVARELGIPRLNLHGTGLDDRGLPVKPAFHVTGGMWAKALDTLKRLADLGERENVTFVLENLNAAVDHPGVPFGRAEDCLALVAAVDRPSLKMMLDLYHAQIGEGNLIDLLRRALPHVGEIQVADVPGRREPGTGEINYPAIAQALAGMDYRGPVGLEAFASGDDVLALNRFREAFS